MLVPAPIRQLFDTFPLVTFPAVANTTPGNTEAIESNKYYFEGPSSTASFSLGVHNVVLHDGKYIPSDPVSYGQALILAHKNNLKFPRPETTDKSRSNHAIVTLSYHSSPDNQLPILIEDTDTRKVQLRLAINHSVATNNFNNKNDTVVNDLVDTKWLDLWILCLLNEDLSLETLNTVFKTDAEVVTSDWINRLTTLQLYHEIPNWNAFKVRHPNLFETGIDRLVSKNTLAAYYDIELRSFESALLLLAQNTNPIIQLKVLAYVVVILALLPDTKLGEIVANHPDLVNKYRAVAAKY